MEAPESASAMVESLKALQQQDDDWYLIMTDKKEDEYIKALAEWAEATEPTEAELGAGVEDHRKLYFAQTANKTLEVTNRRSIIVYHPDEEEAAAAWVGNVGPFYPESVTWKFKRPQDITLPALTEAEREALEEANVNFLTAEYKREYMKNGVCADGEWIDSQMGADYIALTIRNNLYDLLLPAPKSRIPIRDLCRCRAWSFLPSMRRWSWALLRRIRRATEGSMRWLCQPGRTPQTTRQGRGKCRKLPGRRSWRVRYIVLKSAAS